MQLWRKISEQKFKGRDSQSTGKGEIGIAGLMKETEEKYFLKFKKRSEHMIKIIPQKAQ